MNIKDYFKTRPLSWSAISSWEYNPAEWYSKYILNKKEKPNPEMIFGKKFADSCEARKPLAPVTLLNKMEQPFNFVFNGVPMVGYADTFDDLNKNHTGEYKTGVKPWDQKRVDDHGQITMYAMGNFVTNKIKPETCRFFLEWIPTKKVPRENGDYSGFDYDIVFADKPPKVHNFTTVRTMSDIVAFGVRINKTVEAMQAYVDNYACVDN